ncbi:hypothetical protein GHT06_012584 [Daphnia sinensis]|uniref:Uncharacterized protein n=1 Tax=Daphnia sinensis TaxID=1820382 RepID=A0AAD5KXW3_9CRUS|nr:hypothetical protein GHT06_012584 [Daphnia sinensis]
MNKGILILLVLVVLCAVITMAQIEYAELPQAEFDLDGDASRRARYYRPQRRRGSRFPVWLFG